MLDNLNEEQRPINPILSALLFVITILLGFTLIGPILGVFVALPFYEGDFMTFMSDISGGQMVPEIKLPYLILQACATGIGLAVIPMLAYQYIGKMQVGKLFGTSSSISYVVVTLAVIALIFPNSLLIEWNANLDYTGSFWDWAREREKVAEEFTDFITQFDSTGEFILGFFAIAVLPAIGEEFAFRGWLQPTAQKIFGNAHMAIWFSAFVFSAFHFQFFGFLPRLVLGALFGYLMYWSNNLWIPIIAHFVNNGLMIVLVYLNQIKVVEFDAESTEALPIQYVVPFAALFIFLLYYFKKLNPSSEATA